MCLGAIYWARLDRVFYANGRADAALIGFDDAVIYREIDLSADLRRIPMRQMLRDEALAAFRYWESSPNKTPY